MLEDALHTALEDRIVALNRGWCGPRRAHIRRAHGERNRCLTHVHDGWRDSASPAHRHELTFAADVLAHNRNQARKRRALNVEAARATTDLRQGAAGREMRKRGWRHGAGPMGTSVEHLTRTFCGHHKRQAPWLVAAPAAFRYLSRDAHILWQS